VHTPIAHRTLNQAQMSENILHAPALYRNLVLIATEKMSEVVPEKIASEMAVDIATSFCQKHEGEYVRVPNLSRVEKVTRDKQIRKQAETMTPQEIAKLHGLSRSAVSRILNDE